MPHYTSLFNAIAAHIKTAWDVETTSAGRAAKPTPQLPRAVVTLESCDRNQAGRSVEQTWTFTIGGEFALPLTPDPQQFIANQAEALIDLITPFSESSGSIPTVPAAFGGVGYQPFVTTWTPIPMDDADNSCGVLITFTVRTTVWQ